MRNPDKYLREAYILALKDIGVKIYDKKVPASIDTPAKYIIISTQTRTQLVTNKCSRDWDCTTLFDIVSIQKKGFSDSTVVDDIEELIDNAINLETGIPVNKFVIHKTTMESSNSDDLETDSQTIVRKLVRYRHLVTER